MTTDAWGIDDGWTGTDGQWHAAASTTIDAIGHSMGRHGDEQPPRHPVLVARPGSTVRLDAPSALTLEDGTTVGELEQLPPDLPLGLHELRSAHDGAASTLIVSPGRCHLPPDLRTWGLVMQVPTTRSRSAWGIGDLADVGLVARWLDGLGAGALALSPLHAPTPVPPIQSSPYYPSSRRWRNPLLIRVDNVTGAHATPGLPALAAAARWAAEQPGSLIDRDAVWRRQQAALEASCGPIDRRP